MFKQYPDIMNVNQVAEALGVGVKLVYALVKQKKLGNIRMGRTIRVPKFCLEEYIKTARNNVKL